MSVQFLARTIKVGATVTRGTEPTYAVTFADPIKPFIKVECKTIPYDAASGTKGRGWTFDVEVLSVEAFGESGVDALLNAPVWIHAEPDGTIGANNPALTVKDINLLKDSTFTGDIETGSTVRYWGHKVVMSESDAYVKDVTA